MRAALEEDAGGLGDVTTVATIAQGTQAAAEFLAKADGVLAGVAVADAVAAAVDPELHVVWFARDGERVIKGQTLGEWRGDARAILVAERVALNFLQRMSGVATAAAEMAAAAKPAVVLDTRKTAPGLRLLDKWAVKIGGARPHRIGLYDYLMIKDNHIAAAGGMREALQAAEAHLGASGLSLGIEVEARTLEEVDQVIALHKDYPHLQRVMLDNMVVKDASKPGGADVSMLREALGMLQQAGCQLETEASGNVTLETAAAIGATGVQFVSVGALTHSVKAMDISLNIVLQQGEGEMEAVQ